MEQNQEVDIIFEQFEGILNSLTHFKSEITNLQQQIRAVEKKCEKTNEGF